jgi:hypothetical protein
MRRIIKKRYFNLLQKGGGGGGGPSQSIQRQKLNRTNTNRADKSTWNKPPSEPVFFYKSKRVNGTVSGEGKVDWTVDGSTLARANTKVPTQGLKDLKRAWKEYIKSPNSKKKMYAYVANEDGKGAARLKMYLALGFTQRNEKYATMVDFDNR